MGVVATIVAVLALLVLFPIVDRKRARRRRWCGPASRRPGDITRARR